MNGIPVFYCEDMLADSVSFSPSADKPRHVLAAWQEAALPIIVHPVTPASEPELCLAHDPAYVQGIMSGRSSNGFGNTLPEVARSLPYTSGAMVAAARAALQVGCACAPVSGFHHAHYDSAGGYCTFNGLIIAARKMLEEGSARRVLILDCDMHYGDGTDQIIARLGLSGSVTNVTFGQRFHTSAQAAAYLRRLHETVARFKSYDLILYQAGADVHVNDPLGGVLTTEQMRERDKIVFEAARASGIPIAWNLAGGYQEPLSKVIVLHLNTLQECVEVFCGDSIVSDVELAAYPP